MEKKGNVGTKIVVWRGGLVGRRSDRGGLYNPQNEMYQFSKRNVHFLSKD